MPCESHSYIFVFINHKRLLYKGQHFATERIFAVIYGRAYKSRPYSGFRAPTAGFATLQRDLCIYSVHLARTSLIARLYRETRIYSVYCAHTASHHFSTRFRDTIACGCVKVQTTNPDIGASSPEFMKHDNIEIIM